MVKVANVVGEKHARYSLKRIEGIHRIHHGGLSAGLSGQIFSKENRRCSRHPWFRGCRACSRYSLKRIEGDIHFGHLFGTSKKNNDIL